MPSRTSPAGTSARSPKRRRATAPADPSDGVPGSRRRHGLFTRFAKATARKTGRPIAFLLAVGTIVVWLISGPLFKFSDTWQLVVNTATTIVTFLMVFLIQNTQNRDSEAMHLKLDGIICAMGGVKNSLLDLEELEEDELDEIRDRYRRLAERARAGEEADENVGA